MAKIVVVEDQPLMGQLICESLSAAGHDVRFTSNCEAAIDLGHLFKPDVLITDWNLKSDYDGFEVANACRFANRSVQTIIISGYSEVTNFIDSNFEVFRAIVKPFSMASLIDCVDEALCVPHEKTAPCLAS